MARFSLPPLQGGAAEAERTYRELRDEAETCIGAASRERRIEGVLCPATSARPRRPGR
ncbi:MAG TPA: hypothetical protein VMU32_11855 [Solirubrobacteraceae bacterium]|nr:hypothetical protein [Solirubrobacteraceae bacterium]